MPNLFYPEENPWYTMNRRVDRFHGWSGHFYERKNYHLPMPGYGPRFLGQPARSLVTIQTTLSRLPFIMNLRIKTTLLSLPFMYHLLIRGVITLFLVAQNTGALESLSDSRLQAAFKMYAFSFRTSWVIQQVWSVCRYGSRFHNYQHYILTLNGFQSFCGTVFPTRKI